MYAVIATGGKQYRVAEGDVVRFEKLEAEPGAAVEFDRVLVMGQGADVRVGKPYVAGGKVTGTVQAHGKGDKVRMHEQTGRNFRFFDAPVGMIFTIDRVMGQGSLLDYGMFLENIMVAARARGLDTCAQAAFNAYHALISDQLGLDAEREMVVVGMALGHADPEAIENSLLAERVTVSEFATFWP